MLHSEWWSQDEYQRLVGARRSRRKNVMEAVGRKERHTICSADYTVKETVE